MDMKLNAAVIRQEREQRAWSQEHLAGVTGLALRTIQRIESTGSASYESAGAIAAVFELPVAALRGPEIERGGSTARTPRWFTWHRLSIVLGCGLIAAVVTPPNIHVTIPVAVAFWMGCELAIRTRPSDLRADS